MERDGVPLGCCWGAARGGGVSSGQSSLERVERVERVRGLRSAPPNCCSCRSSRAGPATCPTEEGAYLPACGHSGPHAMWRGMWRGGMWRGMCARAGGASRR